MLPRARVGLRYPTDARSLRAAPGLRCGRITLTPAAGDRIRPPPCARSPVGLAGTGLPRPPGSTPRPQPTLPRPTLRQSAHRPLSLGAGALDRLRRLAALCHRVVHSLDRVALDQRHLLIDRPGHRCREQLLTRVFSSAIATCQGKGGFVGGRNSTRVSVDCAGMTVLHWALSKEGVETVLAGSKCGHVCRVEFGALRRRGMSGHPTWP